MATRASERFSGRARLDTTDAIGGDGSQLRTVVFPLAFAALVYGHITGNYFAGDDFMNLYQMANFSLLEYLLTPNGGHLLVARNAVFAGMRQLFGLHAEYFFWCVLLTHLVNVWLLFRLLVLCTDSPRLASWGAALWGISPLHEGTLGYYAVFGHVMVATAFLVILHQALRCGLRGTSPSARQRSVWYGLALVAATSFGTGLALAAALPVVLILLLPSPDRARRAVPLGTLVLVIPVLYYGLLWAYEHESGEALAFGSPLRNMVAYWPYMILGSFRSLAFGLEHLLLGFWSPPWASLWLAYVAVIGLGAAVAYTSRTADPGRRILVAALLLAGSCYLAVGIGRGVQTSMALEGGLTSAARYQYTGMMFLTIVLCIVLARLQPRTAMLSQRTGAVLLTGWYCVTLLLFMVLGPRHANRDVSRGRTFAALAELQSKIRSVPAGQSVYIRNHVFPALPNFVVPATSFPGLAAAFCIYFPSNVVDGHAVYFIEANPVVQAATARGHRTHALLVAEEVVDGNGEPFTF